MKQVMIPSVQPSGNLEPAVTHRRVIAEFDSPYINLHRPLKVGENLIKQNYKAISLCLKQEL
jgi:hypothetical protein